MKCAVAILLEVIITVMLHGQVRSTTIPEDVVWTKPRAAFWEGQRMVSLSCLFRGEPIAVYWAKGESDETAEDLIWLYNGQKNGVRFNDGSLDINQNYSLVFKQPVEFNIAGRYICRVSNYKGIASFNSTIVSVREFQIQTAPRLTVWKGESASLPCGLPYTPYRVQWVNVSNGEVLANFTNGTFHPPPSGKSRYSMDENFILTIREVSVLDESTLKCEVFPYNSKSWVKSTALIVNAYGDGPSFVGCRGNAPCTTEENDRKFQLSCKVRGAKPDVTMSLTAAGNSSLLTFLPVSFERWNDGTSDQTVFANVSINPESSSETFTCTAIGEAVYGSASATITVNVKSGAGGFPLAVIIVIVFMLILLVLGLVVFLVYRWKVDQPELEGLRTKIKKYKPGSATDIKLAMDKVNLGVFGLMATGKSAFINSVMFALTGAYHKHSDELEDTTGMTGGSCTLKRTPYLLTDHITLFDNRGLTSYSTDTPQYKHQMKEFVEGDESIHCPIFLADAREEHDTNSPWGLIYDFSSEVEKLCGQKLKFVFTHKTEMESEGQDPRALYPSIPKEDMIAVENYTVSDHTESVERSTELLKFIWSCLERAERNVEPKERKKTERKKNKEEELRNDMARALMLNHWH